MAAKKSKPEGVELAVAYVSLTVDASKVGEEVEDELDAAGKAGGKKAGQAVEKELGKSGKESGKKAGSDFGKELGERASTAAKAAGVAAGAAIAVGLKSAASQADLQGSIKAQLGTTPEYAKEIAEAAGESLKSGWGDSLDEVGRTAAAVGQKINEMGDGASISDLTTKATVLAKTFDQDTQAIANSAAQLIRNGLAPDLDAAFDLITVGLQSNTKMSEDFLDTIDEYGVQFKALGLSGADATGLIADGLAAGARNGDMVADSLKEFAIRAVDGSKSTAEGFDAIGLKADDMAAKIAKGGPSAKEALGLTLDKLREMKDPTAQAAAAVALFGTKAEDMQAALFALDPSKAAAGLGDLNGKAAQFVADSTGMDQQLAGIANTLSLGLGAALTPLLPQLKDLADIGLQFFRWLGENPIVTQVILGIGAALGVAAAAQWAFNAAQLANPTTWIIFAIIVAIGLLVAGILWLRDNWGLAMEFLGAAGRGLLIGLTHVWNGIIHGINGGIHAVNGLGRALEAVLSLGGLLGDWNWGEIPTFGLVDVPGLAEGGTVTGSGTTLVGEYGPELLNLPKGSTVVPLDHPAANVRTGDSSGASVTINNINPVAEKSSESTRKNGQILGAILA